MLHVMSGVCVWLRFSSHSSTLALTALSIKTRFLQHKATCESSEAKKIIMRCGDDHLDTSSWVLLGSNLKIFMNLYLSFCTTTYRKKRVKS